MRRVIVTPGAASRAAAALGTSVVLLVGCVSPSVPEARGPGLERPVAPSYTLTLQTRSGTGAPAAVSLAGRFAHWDPTIGAIVLGPEERGGGPLAQLILKISEGIRPGAAKLESATLSTTDVREGTADQLDAMLFGGSPTPVTQRDDPDDEGYCNIDMVGVDGVGDDYIVGGFCFDLQGLEPADVPDTVRVHGTFDALSR